MPPMPHSGMSAAFFDHYSAEHVLTDAVMLRALREQYPHAHITNVNVGYQLTKFAAGGQASAIPLAPDENLTRRGFSPPARRLDGEKGNIVEEVLYQPYAFKWKGRSWLLYCISGRDGTASFPILAFQFLVSGEGTAAAGGGASDEFGESQDQSQLLNMDDRLIEALVTWGSTLRQEIWVFNQGFWQTDAELYKSVAKASWDNVILDADMKKALQADAKRFFDGRQKYSRLAVPWKRGVIFYGPPGNGKTISIKALMHTLSEREPEVPTLYVRSLTSFQGPEYSLMMIFRKAREYAPCLLVFEDLDSLVTPQVRSYFLNEVDGLAANDGILMIGSTNHLDQLDPGISKRPSRFDRKFLFPKPNLEERTMYAEFWRRKLDKRNASDHDDEDRDWEKDFGAVAISGGATDATDAPDAPDPPDVDFPKALCPKMASITDDFSFAYMQEAFIASLLTIAAEYEEEEAVVDSDDKPLEELKLWKVFKKQVESLRHEI